MRRARERLQARGFVLPEAVAAAAHYVPAVRHGGLLFLSGQTPRVGADMAVRGRVGAHVDLAAAQHAAQLCALRLLAAAEAACGSLDAVARVLELRVYVQCAPDFTQHSAVADAASDLLATAFGDAGRHARTAVGVAQLPGDAAVEIAATFALHA